MCFVSVMLIPIVYCFVIPIWLTRAVKPCLQYWSGYLLYIGCGPFLNICVLVYACFYMDSFGWGKTRKVISDEGEQSGSQNELERLLQSEKSKVVDQEKALLPATDTANPARAVRFDLEPEATAQRKTEPSFV